MTRKTTRKKARKREPKTGYLFGFAGRRRGPSRPPYTLVGISNWVPVVETGRIQMPPETPEYPGEGDD